MGTLTIPDQPSSPRPQHVDAVGQRRVVVVELVLLVVVVQGVVSRSLGRLVAQRMLALSQL